MDGERHPALKPGKSQAAHADVRALIGVRADVRG
jgi:hypothetical protein